MLEKSVKDDVCVGVVFVHFPLLFFIYPKWVQHYFITVFIFRVAFTVYFWLFDLCIFVVNAVPLPMTGSYQKMNECCTTSCSTCSDVKRHKNTIKSDLCPCFSFPCAHFISKRNKAVTTFF